MRERYTSLEFDSPCKCMGIHLDYLHMRVILAALVWRFTLTLGDTSDAEMEMD